MESTASDQFTIGLSLHRSGRMDDAVYFYNKALEKDPKLPEALINLGAAVYWNKINMIKQNLF